MSKDLTNSTVARQNVLNNELALKNIETHLALGGFQYEGETVFTKAQVANILQVDERTIDRYIHDNGDELRENGYQIFTSQALKNLRSQYVDDMNVVDIPAKAPSLGIFTFRAVLNLAMLCTESETAKAIRTRILDIVLDVIAQKSGGHTKYINQRDSNFLPAMLNEESYRKKYTNALKDHLNMGNHKYAIYTDKIYKAIFLENAKEYKKILKLSKSDKTRETMYTEVLEVIASFENGLAEQIVQQATQLGRKLQAKELDELIENATNSPFLKPSIDGARQKMASRDLCFRDAQHQRLERYIQAVPKEDFQKFLGETSQSLAEQLSDPEILKILQRLKDR